MWRIRINNMKTFEERKITDKQISDCVTVTLPFVYAKYYKEKGELSENKFKNIEFVTTKLIEYICQK